MLTLKSGESEVVSPPALDVLDPVDDDRPPEDVGEDEDVELLEGGARLGGQVEQAGPVLGELRVVEGEVELERLLDLPLAPARVEPANENEGTCSFPV